MGSEIQQSHNVSVAAVETYSGAEFYSTIECDALGPDSI